MIKELREISMKKEQNSLKSEVIENLEKFCKVMKERISSLIQEEYEKTITI
jgi:hypothetical protein